MKEIEQPEQFEFCKSEDHWFNMIVDGRCMACEKELAQFDRLPLPSDHEIDMMSLQAQLTCYKCVSDGEPCEEHRQVETASEAFRTAN